MSVPIASPKKARPFSPMSKPCPVGFSNTSVMDPWKMSSFSLAFHGD